MTKLAHKILKSKRREILLKIDRLEKRRCPNCTMEGVRNAESARYLCNCDSAVKIRILGDKLMDLITKRIDPTEEFLKTLPEELTVKVYREIKSLDFDGKVITDRAIARHYKMSGSTWTRWKNEHNLIT